MLSIRLSTVLRWNKDVNINNNNNNNNNKQLMTQYIYVSQTNLMNRMQLRTGHGSQCIVGRVFCWCAQSSIYSYNHITTWPVNERFRFQRTRCNNHWLHHCCGGGSSSFFLTGGADSSLGRPIAAGVAFAHQPRVYSVNPGGSNRRQSENWWVPIRATATLLIIVFEWYFLSSLYCNNYINHHG